MEEAKERYRWVIEVIVYLGSIMLGMILFSIGPMLITLTQELQITLHQSRPPFRYHRAGAGNFCTYIRCCVGANWTEAYYVSRDNDHGPGRHNIWNFTKLHSGIYRTGSVRSWGRTVFPNGWGGHYAMVFG